MKKINITGDVESRRRIASRERPMEPIEKAEKGTTEQHEKTTDDTDGAEPLPKAGRRKAVRNA